MADLPMSKTQVMVKNLPPYTSNDRLKAAFIKFGAITDNFVPQRKRFGFVTFEKEADQQSALAMNGQPLDDESAAAGDEPVTVEIARQKAANPENPKKQAPKKQASKKAGEKKGPAKGAKAEGENAPAKKRTKESRPKPSGGVDAQARKDNYDQEIPVKCLLLGYLHQVAAQEQEDYKPDSGAKAGFPGIEWIQKALEPAGVQKSLFYQKHTAVYTSTDDAKWTVTVEGTGAAPVEGNGLEPCPEHSAAVQSLRTALVNEARYSMTLDDTEIAVNRAKLYLLNKLNTGKAKAEKKPAANVSAPAPAKKSVDKKPEAEEEFDIEKQRAAARENAAKFAASLTEEEAAIYGAKKQVAAAGVRPDSDSDDDGEADFAVGGDDDGILLGDY